MAITDITQISCSVLTIVDGQNHRKAYANSAEGRAEFMTECADCENYADVMAAWGDTPTVVYEPLPEPSCTTPTQQDQIDANAAAIEELAAIIAEVMV